MVSECEICQLYKIAVDASSARRGVKPGFEPYHVLGFLLLAWAGPVGRPLASKALELGDTATKTLMRRLRDMGAIIQVGRSGVTTSGETKRILDEISPVIHGNCVGFDLPCVKGQSVCRDMGLILQLRDALVSRGVRLKVIMCCAGGVEIPGVPEEYRSELVREATPCLGKSVCVLLEGEASVIDAGKVLAATLEVLCGASNHVRG